MFQLGIVRHKEKNMSSTADVSMESTKTQSPLYGIGRLLGSATFKLLRCSQNPERVIKFVVSLGLLFNLRIYRKKIAEKGYVTFFVSTPREGEFDPKKASSRGNSYMTSFKISEEILGGSQLSSPFCSIEKMSWDELRLLSGNCLPEEPHDLNLFKDIFSNFTPELLNHQGSFYYQVGCEARRLREALEESSSSTNIDEFL